MPKVLSLIGLVISILVFVIFLLDLIAPYIALGLAPFKNASPMMDIAFVLCAGATGYLSWVTLREQG